MPDQNAAFFDLGSAVNDEDESLLDYDEECERVRKQNAVYLEMFERSMREQGLAESTVHRHLGNAEFYLNDYLLYYDVNDMEFGCFDVGGFLGDFFIRKCTWSSPATIKENATSIRKFYQCMRDNGLVSSDDYAELAQTIEEDMGEWLAAFAAFNDQDDSSFFDDLDGLDDFDFDELDDGLSENPPSAAAPTREEIVNLFTLALFYLTSWEERVGGKEGPLERRAWKSADWDALDALRESGLIHCTNKAKSVTLTEDGIAQARRFISVLGLGHLLK